MAVTLISSGTQACVVGTEHTLYTWAAGDAGKTGVFAVDLAAMVNGDTYELRVYGVLLSGGTERVIYSASYSHQQADPIKLSPPIPQDLGASGLRFTIKAIAGARSVPWKVNAL